MKTLSLFFLLATLPPAAKAGTGLTVYNEDFAVVRDEIPLSLSGGTEEVRYGGVTSRLEPESVVLRDPSGEVDLRIVEQSYRGDPVNEERLLQMFEGETIRFLRRFADEEVILDGRIVRAPVQTSSGRLEPIVEVDGELRTQLPGEPLFPGLGDDSILQPTLTWKLYAPEEVSLDAELSYLTRGLSWKADYNLILPEEGDAVALSGWVSVENASGKTFRDAGIKLIAGDVNKLEDRDSRRDQGLAVRAFAATAKEPPPEVEERKFDEFHLYELPGQIDLRDRETKQLEFVRAESVGTRKIYVYDGASVGSGWRFGGINQNPSFGKNESPDVAIYREFKNSEENNLGVPLPAGVVRFYRADRDGQIEFIGENRIDHTPRNETLRLRLGNAFDLVGERTQTEFYKHPSRDLIRESFAIEIRNRSEEKVTVRIVEHLYRALTWKILESTRPFEKTDSRTIEFSVTVPPDGTAKTSYTVEYTW